MLEMLTWNGVVRERFEMLNWKMTSKYLKCASTNVRCGIKHLHLIHSACWDFGTDFQTGLWAIEHAQSNGRDHRESGDANAVINIFVAGKVMLGQRGIEVPDVIELTSGVDTVELPIKGHVKVPKIQVLLDGCFCML